jgi:hypothetical protein
MRKKALRDAGPAAPRSSVDRQVAEGAGESRQSSASAASTARAPRHEQAPESGALLVLVELGSEWPRLTAPSAPRRVVAQQEGEAPAAFAERVASALDGLFGRGVRMETVILACNERLDPSADEARRRLIGLALGQMAAHRSGRALLSAPPRSAGRLRHALVSLARGLHDEWRTAGLEASVDFGVEGPADATTPAFQFTARVA